MGFAVRSRRGACLSANAGRSGLSSPRIALHRPERVLCRLLLGFGSIGPVADMLALILERGDQQIDRFVIDPVSLGPLGLVSERDATA